MITHIDVSTVLRRTVCDLYSNLVTRPTGAAVRGEIECLLAESEGRTLTVIDFTNVSLLDFSCADEIVAKLLLRYAGREGAAAPPDDGFFLFRGLHDSHLDAVEAVLERHGLALVSEGDAGVHLVGTVDDAERTAWEGVCRLGGARAADELADATGLSLEAAADGLERLCRRRLVMRLDAGYVAVGQFGVGAADDEEGAE